DATLVEAFLETQRQSAEAHAAYQRAVADAHSAFLRSSEAAMQTIASLLGGAHGDSNAVLSSAPEVARDRGSRPAQSRRPHPNPPPRAEEGEVDAQDLPPPLAGEGRAEDPAPDLGALLMEVV